MAKPDEIHTFLKSYDGEVAAIALRLREIVRSAAPSAEEKLQTGWKVVQYTPPAGSMAKKIGCAISPQRDRVHLAFPNGANLDAPGGLLEGTGKAMRHVKVRSLKDIKVGVFKTLVRASMAPPG